jgi:hypothetical protein
MKDSVVATGKKNRNKQRCGYPEYQFGRALFRSVDEEKKKSRHHSFFSLLPSLPYTGVFDKSEAIGEKN